MITPANRASIAPREPDNSNRSVAKGATTIAGILTHLLLSNTFRSAASVRRPMFRPYTLGPPPSTASRIPCLPENSATKPKAAKIMPKPNSAAQKPSMVARTPYRRRAATVSAHDQATNNKSYDFPMANVSPGAHKLVMTM